MYRRLQNIALYLSAARTHQSTPSYFFLLDSKFSARFNFSSRPVCLRSFCWAHARTVKRKFIHALFSKEIQCQQQKSVVIKKYKDVGWCDKFSPSSDGIRNEKVSIRANLLWWQDKLSGTNVILIAKANPWMLYRKIVAAKSNIFIMQAHLRWCYLYNDDVCYIISSSIGAPAYKLLDRTRVLHFAMRRCVVLSGATKSINYTIPEWFPPLTCISHTHTRSIWYYVYYNANRVEACRPVRQHGACSK